MAFSNNRSENTYHFYQYCIIEEEIILPPVLSEETDNARVVNKSVAIPVFIVLRCFESVQKKQEKL